MQVFSVKEHGHGASVDSVWTMPSKPGVYSMTA